MNEDKTVSYIEQAKINAQITIIRQIAEQGLCASETEARLRSYDSKPNKDLSLYLVLPEFKDINHYQGTHLEFFSSVLSSGSPNPFHDLIHKEATGIWPIILERSFITGSVEHDRTSDRLEWEDRLNSSILLVLKYPDAAPKNPSFKIFGALKTACSIAFEWQTEAIIDKNEIIAILAPPQIAVICKQIYPDVPIYETQNCVNTTCIPKGGSPLPSHREYLEGPNYASKLESLVTQKELPPQFACHVTRLPTKRDFLKLDHCRTQLSPNGLLQKFNTDSADNALRKIAAGYGSREDLEFLYSVFPGINVNSQSPSNNRTALHWALYKPKIDVEMVRAILRFNPQCDIPDNAKKTATTLANKRGLNLEELMNGTYDRKIFKERALEDPQLKELPADHIGQFYKPRWP